MVLFLAMLTDSQPAIRFVPAEAQMDEQLIDEWSRAVGGDEFAQMRWQRIDGGEWTWRHDGVRVEGTGPEWIALQWMGWDASAARELKNFVIEVTISGKAEAAGLSFGGFKDFLASPLPERPRRLQLEVDANTGRWAFRVDGQLMHRAWWDAAVMNVDDILDGALRLKVRRAGDMLFQNLTVQILDASCQLSVIITCSRFLQRLRLSLRNWCHQNLPSGAHEVLVVNPQSPDGTHEHLAAVARSYPHVRVREIAVGNDLVRNKGAMINRGFAESCGEWLWLTDADCLFGPQSAAKVLQQVRGRQNRLFYGQRRFLTATQTDALLSSRVDPLKEFDDLVSHAVLRPPEQHQWGYTQIIHRSTFARVRYREDQNHFAHSDGIFAEACRRCGILPQPLEDLFCLHLDHPFSWYGSDMFL
jgi:Glycosyl transferase family 2